MASLSIFLQRNRKQKEYKIINMKGEDWEHLIFCRFLEWLFPTSHSF